MGFYRHTDGYNDSKKLVIPYSTASVPSVVELWKERTKEIRYTSMRMLRTLNSCFERFTQQFSSVSTEQSQAGVKSSVWSRIRERWLWKGLRRKKMSKYLKKWNRKKYILWCKLQGVMISYMETDRENFFETLEKGIQFTRVCEDASFCKRVSMGMCHKPLQTWMTVLEIQLQHAQSLYPRTDSDSRIYAAVPGRPFLQVHIIQFLGTHGIENSDSIHDNAKSKFLGSDMPRKESLRWWITSQIQDTIPRVMICFWKDLLQEKLNFVLPSWSNPALRKIMRRSPKLRWFKCVIRKKLFLLEKVSGMTFLLANLSKETLFRPKPQLNIGHEIGASLWSRWTRKLTVLIIGILWFQNCGKHFQSPEGENSRTRIGFNTNIKLQDEVPVLFEFPKFFIIQNVSSIWRCIFNHQCL